MGVYYKFKSAKDYDSVPLDGHFISVGQLKAKIFELKRLGGTDFDLIVTNAQTNEEYLDEGVLVPKNTSVLIRRVPGLPRKRIVAAPVGEQEWLNAVHISGDVQAVKACFDQSSGKYAQDLEWDDFGDDIYATPVPSSMVMPVSKEEQESKIKGFTDTCARIMPAGFEKKIVPAQGYVCHRCKVPGHFIQHCPTNGDPNFDMGRRVIPPPTGIPSGAAGVSKRNEKEIPRELHCPLCQQVMKDAVFASKCCFKSFCEKCIRDHLISKSRCECGATCVVADHLLPNKTLRDTINRVLESNSPTQCAASNDQQQVLAPPPQQPAINVPLKSEKDDHSRTGTVPLADEEVQQRSISGEEAEASQQKKIPMQLAENYMRPMGPFAFNGMQPGFDGFMPYGAAPMPYPQFGGFLPYHPFAGHGGILPYAAPQRDLSELVVATGREKFEADLKRKREMERRDEERELSKGSSTVTDNASSRSKSKSKSDEYHEDRDRGSNGQHQEPLSKKRKVSSSDRGLNGQHEDHKAAASRSRKSGSAIAASSIDDERHFKRRPSRYTSARCVAEEKDHRHSRGSRDIDSSSRHRLRALF